MAECRPPCRFRHGEEAHPQWRAPRKTHPAFATTMAECRPPCRFRHGEEAHPQWRAPRKTHPAFATTMAEGRQPCRLRHGEEAHPHWRATRKTAPRSLCHPGRRPAAGGFLPDRKAPRTPSVNAMSGPVFHGPGHNAADTAPPGKCQAKPSHRGQKKLPQLVRKRHARCLYVNENASTQTDDVRYDAGKQRPIRPRAAPTHPREPFR